MKRIFALLMVLCLFCTSTVTAFAAGSAETNEVDYMNYEFPDDAVVLYQSEDGVIYQSKQKSDELALASDMTYNDVYIPAGHYNLPDPFTIENPHWMPFTTTYGTFKIESEYQRAEVNMILCNGGTEIYANYYVSISNNDIHFEFKSTTKNLTVYCFPKETSDIYGIRAMCWLY